MLLNILLHILSLSGVVELTTQLLILENILWLPLCRINKFGLNTLPSKTVVISYTCGLSGGPRGGHEVAGRAQGGRARPHPRGGLGTLLAHLLYSAGFFWSKNDLREISGQLDSV